MAIARAAVAGCLSLVLAATAARAQQRSDEPAPDGKRIFGIIPNYRTSPTLTDYQPLSPKEKVRLASDDAFDRGTFVLAALFAAEAQMKAATPSYGHGLTAYAKYFSASTADWVIGDFMTEGVYPVVLHQDPRYFRRGSGSGWSRLRYAIAQIFVTHADSGAIQFNYSEVFGNATATALGNAYYPDNRTLSSNMAKFGIQIGVDMAANILKEFSPDVERALAHPHKSATGSADVRSNAGQVDRNQFLGERTTIGP